MSNISSGKMVVSENALRRIKVKLNEVQKKITKNEQKITAFLDTVKQSGWDDAQYQSLKSQTDKSKEDLKPIRDAMKRFEDLKGKEADTVKRIGELIIPKR